MVMTRDRGEPKRAGREKSLIINTEAGDTRSTGAQGKDENEDDDEETRTTTT